MTSPSREAVQLLVNLLLEGGGEYELGGVDDDSLLPHWLVDLRVFRAAYHEILVVSVRSLQKKIFKNLLNNFILKIVILKIKAYLNSRKQILISADKIQVQSPLANLRTLCPQKNA